MAILIVKVRVTRFQSMGGLQGDVRASLCTGSAPRRGVQ
jgi:hypothetical protein